MGKSLKNKGENPVDNEVNKMTENVDDWIKKVINERVESNRKPLIEERNKTLCSVASIDKEILQKIFERNCLLDRAKSISDDLIGGRTLFNHTVNDILDEYKSNGMESVKVKDAVKIIRNLFFDDSRREFKNIEFFGIDGGFQSTLDGASFVFSRNGVPFFALDFGIDRKNNSYLGYYSDNSQEKRVHLYCEECVGGEITLRTFGGNEERLNERHAGTVLSERNMFCSINISDVRDEIFKLVTEKNYKVNDVYVEHRRFLDEINYELGVLNGGYDRY